MVDILIVDDHPLFRDGFASMVRVLRPAWTLQFADSVAQALYVLNNFKPHLIIVDVVLQASDGFALVKAVKNISTAIPQILISGRDDAAVRMRARACGVNGFISKTTSSEKIVEAIDLVLSGGFFFDANRSDCDMPLLKQRHIELLMMLAAGHSNKEIRYRMNIAERTVRAHLTELFHLLGVHSRMQATVRARELGLIE